MPTYDRPLDTTEPRDYRSIEKKEPCDELIGAAAFVGLVVPTFILPP